MSVFDLRGAAFLDEIAQLWAVKREKTEPDDSLRDKAGDMRYKRCSCGGRKKREAKRCLECEYKRRRAA